MSSFGDADLLFEPPRVPELSRAELSWGRLIGSGAFSKVFEGKLKAESVSGSTSISSSTHSESDETQLSPVSLKRLSSSRHLPTYSMREKITFEPLRVESYAIKTILDPNEDKESIIHEASILALLPRHKNIVALHAVSESFWDRSVEEHFLVLERLPKTLQFQLSVWRSRNSTTLKDRLFSRGKVCDAELQRVASCAVGIARALRHLHKHEIIFRDLKPSNIGLTSDGIIKLFDFGLARLMPENNILDTGRRLTIFAGTLRYMAPELVATDSYDLSVDVYSFGLLLWEICTLRKPYAEVSCLDQLEKLIKAHSPPPLRKVSNSSIRQLIKQCWLPEPTARPTFVSISCELDSLCSDYLEDDEASFA